MKKNDVSKVIKHKAWLILKGHVGVDFDKVFAPITSIESVWLLLSLAA
jgi:hypothetical protein